MCYWYSSIAVQPELWVMRLLGFQYCDGFLLWYCIATFKVPLLRSSSDLKHVDTSFFSFFGREGLRKT